MRYLLEILNKKNLNASEQHTLLQLLFITHAFQLENFIVRLTASYHSKEEIQAILTFLQPITSATTLKDFDSTLLLQQSITIDLSAKAKTEHWLYLALHHLKKQDWNNKENLIADIFAQLGNHPENLLPKNSFYAAFIKQDTDEKTLAELMTLLNLLADKKISLKKIHIFLTDENALSHMKYQCKTPLDIFFKLHEKEKIIEIHSTDLFVNHMMCFITELALSSEKSSYPFYLARQEMMLQEGSLLLTSEPLTTLSDKKTITHLSSLTQEAIAYQLCLKLEALFIEANDFLAALEPVAMTEKRLSTLDTNKMNINLSSPNETRLFTFFDSPKKKKDLDFSTNHQQIFPYGFGKNMMWGVTLGAGFSLFALFAHRFVSEDITKEMAPLPDSLLNQKNI